jgi:ribosomal protein S27AE
VSTAVILRNEEGATRVATGTWQSFDVGARSVKAVGFAVGGVLCAMPLVLVPILHLVTTWLLPLLGMIAAVNAWRTQEKLTSIQGECPSCSDSVTLEGGQVVDQMHDTCPACNRIVFIQRDQAEKP